MFCYTDFDMLRYFHLIAVLLFFSLAGFCFAGCSGPDDDAYEAPDPPAINNDGEAIPYLTATGTLTGTGILILDGKKHDFEPIGKASLSNINVKYVAAPSKDARVVTIGGDFAGEEGLLEYPDGKNRGQVRILLRAGEDPTPFALSVVMSGTKANKADVERLNLLVNYYKGEALLDRAQAALEKGDAEAAEGFARQALDASADARRGNFLMASAYVKMGKSADASLLLSSAAEKGRLGAPGYDMWLRLLDKEDKSSEGLDALEEAINSEQLDAATEIAVRGSLYHRRLIDAKRFTDARANLTRYIDLAESEEIARAKMPLSLDESRDIIGQLEGILSGEPTQLLEERFEKMPDDAWGAVSGKWKLTQAKGESFLTAVPEENNQSELFPKNAIGYTKDIRVSIRARLRDTSSRLSVCPLWNADGAYRLVITSTWIRLYYATPPRQSDLEAELLGEFRPDSPIDGKWLTVSTTTKSGDLSVSIEGEVVIESKGKVRLKDGGPGIIASGGVIDIDDLVVTSL
ncbi:hypothetical protein J7K50_10220 [bacterium]|nr:hypothetical protein [bacterium]